MLGYFLKHTFLTVSNMLIFFIISDRRIVGFSEFETIEKEMTKHFLCVNNYIFECGRLYLLSDQSIMKRISAAENEKTAT